MLLEYAAIQCSCQLRTNKRIALGQGTYSCMIPIRFHLTYRSSAFRKIIVSNARCILELRLSVHFSFCTFCAVFFSLKHIKNLACTSYWMVCFNKHKGRADQVSHNGPKVKYGFSLWCMVMRGFKRRVLTRSLRISIFCLIWFSILGIKRR